MGLNLSKYLINSHYQELNITCYKYNSCAEVCTPSFHKF